MLKIIADTHTHTLACDHAYSTLSDNVAAAKARGLDAIALTEHSPSMPGAPSWLHFSNLGIIPRVIDGITIIKGIEVNIMDYSGSLDFEDHGLKKLDWVIASMHTPNLAPSNKKDHTDAWIAVANNPLVDVIGHCGDMRYDFDHEPVLLELKKNNKIIEINSHSFNARPGSSANCEKIALRCAELGIPVVVSSDAHHACYIGEFTASVNMLERIDFPEKLVLNAHKERFFAVLEERKSYKA